MLLIIIKSDMLFNRKHNRILIHNLSFNKKPRKKMRGLAFGIDRNQESFFFKKKRPTEVATVVAN